MLGDRTDEDEEVLKTKTSTVAVTALVQIPLEELGSSRKAKKPHKHISLGLFRKQQVSGEEIMIFVSISSSRVSVWLVTVCYSSPSSFLLFSLFSSSTGWLISLVLLFVFMN